MSVRPSVGPSVRPSVRDAFVTSLVDASFRPFFQLNTSLLEFENNWLPMDGPTDGRTNGRTKALIEMRGRI